MTPRVRTPARDTNLPGNDASKKHMSPLIRRVSPESSLRFSLIPLIFWASTASVFAQTSHTDATQVVRAAVNAEMKADRADQSIWMYHDHDVVPGKDAMYLTIETRQGSLKRMIDLNGKPLSPSAIQAETNRINSYIHDSSAQAKARKNEAHDDAQAAEMLQMLPEAFLWSIVKETPEDIVVRYTPNPNFNPPDMQARVMGRMAGEMVIARDGDRIRTLRGTLTEDVLIGYGFLAKLYKGGTFDVERRDVGGGHWQITETHVHIGGHALLFRDIGQQEDEVKTEWKPSPDETLAGAAKTLDAEASAH
jgi:hypothetical protein